jgi:hypothetical protein
MPRHVPEVPPIDQNKELQEWAVTTMVQLSDVLRATGTSEDWPRLGTLGAL